MVKKIFGTIVALLSAFVLSGQMPANENISWRYSVEPLQGDTCAVTLTATIAPGWHIYDFGPYAGGPNALEILLAPKVGAELVGDIEAQQEAHIAYSEMFKKDVGSYEGRPKFVQKVVTTAPETTIDVLIKADVCEDGGSCTSSQSKLTVKISNPNASGATIKAEAESTSGSTQNLWSMIIEAILWGFMALLTPCVFPMVPMTVSFFLKSSKNKAANRFKAIMYGIFIVTLYTLPIAALIIITRVVGGDAVTANIFNWLATHWLPNLIFFAVFMVFAASFFGAFEIVMPSKLVNKSDSNSDRGGLGGVFFMALTLVLVSFSCTGPIVGTVLIKSTSGEFWAPILTMLAFSTAFALPFMLCALFPSLLNTLPKSGGWLNSVKVVLGFVELALGLKFLSVADQTYHWGILDREIYLALWIVIFTLLGFYLLGKLKFKHDSEVKYIGVPRLIMSIIVFAFVVYMIPGMWGAPLRGLSGYMPPISTQDFVIEKYACPVASTGAVSSSESAGRKYADFLHLPYNLEGFFDLEEAKEYASKQDKPIFIDFTGHGCVNCREMEARVWSDERVLDHLRNNYVVTALYVDDKKVVAEEDWVVTESGKTLKRLGDINSHYALTEFKVNAQPYYVLMSPEGKVLVEPRAYDLSVDGFVKFLESGLAAYEIERLAE
ncbi:MAG: thioredoxin family protein [Tidjanibacter sp.]|nr:thioredoxin family protein [Tidjanibacter sp.]